MDKLLIEYKDKFGECFPLMLVMGMSDDKICELIKECLETNKSYEVNNEYDY